MEFSPPVALKVNGQEAQALGCARLREEWEENFDGAWRIELFIPDSKKKSWEEVSVLVHEMGHVLDYRENLFLVDSSVFGYEKRATKNAKKIIKTLDLPMDELGQYLDALLDEYRRALKGKDKWKLGIDISLGNQKEPKKKTQKKKSLQKKG